MAKNKIKLVFVFSGSGTKFPVFIGALRRIEEFYEQLGYEIEIELVIGTSGGAVISAGIASGFYDSYKLEEMCRELMPQISKILKPSLTSLLWRFGLFNTKGLVKLFEEAYVEKMGDTLIPAKIVTVDIDAKGKEKASKVYSTKETPEVSLIQATLASMSIPFVFPHVFLNGRRHIDGGWLKNFAVDEADGDGIIGFYFGDSLSKAKKLPKWRIVTRLLHYATRLIDISITQNMRESIEDMRKMENARLYKLSTTASGLDFNISQDDISKMIQDGYDSVDRRLRNI